MRTLKGFAPLARASANFSVIHPGRNRGQNRDEKRPGGSLSHLSRS